MRANAMSPEKAVALDDLSFVMSRRLTRLVDTGVIRKAGSGAYYLSAPDLADHEEARRHRALYVMLFLVAVFLAFAAWIPNHRS